MFSISVRKLGFSETARSLSRIPDRLDRAMYDATRDGVDLLENYARAGMEEIAGGAYWETIPQVNRAPGGAKGSVTTPPSKAHRIEPTEARKAKARADYAAGKRRTPRAFLKFEGANGDVFSTGVNHPGSNPVNWPDRLGGFNTAAEHIYEREIGRGLG